MAKRRAYAHAAGFAAFLFFLSFSCIAFLTVASSGPDLQDGPLSPNAAPTPRDSFRPWDEFGIETPADAWPAWLTEWALDQGAIVSNPAAWHIPAETPADRGNLYLVLARASQPGNLTMELRLWGSAGASLHLDLLTTNMLDVATNLYGNLLRTGDVPVQLDMAPALAANPAASVIRLRRTAGEIALYDLLLRENRTDVTLETHMPPESADSGGAADPGSRAVQDLQPPEDNSAEPSRGAADGVANMTGRGKTLYVDAAKGHDENDGFAAAVESNGRGPKKSINGALRSAREGDSISISSGTYRETSDFRGKGVKVYFTGTVFM